MKRFERQGGKTKNSKKMVCKNLLRLLRVQAKDTIIRLDTPCNRLRTNLSSLICLLICLFFVFLLSLLCVQRCGTFPCKLERFINTLYYYLISCQTIKKNSNKLLRLHHGQTEDTIIRLDTACHTSITKR